MDKSPADAMRHDEARRSVDDLFVRDEPPRDVGTAMSKATGNFACWREHRHRQDDCPAVGNLVTNN